MRRGRLVELPFECLTPAIARRIVGEDGERRLELAQDGQYVRIVNASQPFDGRLGILVCPYQAAQRLAPMAVSGEGVTVAPSSASSSR